MAGIVVMRPIADAARARAVTHIAEALHEAAVTRRQRVVARLTERLTERLTAHLSTVLTGVSRTVAANTNSE